MRPTFAAKALRLEGPLEDGGAVAAVNELPRVRAYLGNMLGVDQTPNHLSVPFIDVEATPAPAPPRGPPRLAGRESEGQGFG